MEIRNLVWSATTCDFPGAGVYLGLAPFSEHSAVARLLTARQLRAYPAGTCRMRTNGDSWPVNYFAVRDPSAVKVKPLDKPPLSNGFRHVKLVFQFERASGREEGQAISGVEGTSPAFLLTIGLRPTKEEDFFSKVLGDCAELSWGDIYNRLRDLGCRDTSEFV